MITTVQRCASCRTTWRGRGARWCSRCGGRLAPVAATGHPGRSWGRRGRGRGGILATLGRNGAVVGVAALLLVTTLVAAALGGGDSGLVGRPGAPPGQGEVDLEAALSADAPIDGGAWDGEPRPVPLDGTGWRVALDSASVAATGDGEVVVTGTRKGVVHALDARTGAPRWATDLGTAAAALLLHDDLVLVRHAGGQATVLGRDEGELRWRRAPGLEEDRVLAVGASGDVVLLVLGLPDRPRLLAADAQDGTRRWEQLLSGGWIADDRGAVTPVGVVDGVLTGFEPASGAARWERELGPDERTVEVVDGLVLVRASDGYRWIDTAGGDVTFLSGRLLGSWLAHPEDGLVLGSTGGTSLLLSADRTGTERWRTSLPRVGGRQECCIGLAATSTGEVLVADRRGPEPIVRLLDPGDGGVIADLSDLELLADRRVLAVTAATAVVVGTAGTLGIDRAERTPRWRVAERTLLLSSDPVLLATTRGGDGHGPATSSLIAPP